MPRCAIASARTQGRWRRYARCPLSHTHSHSVSFSLSSTYVILQASLFFGGTIPSWPIWLLCACPVHFVGLQFKGVIRELKAKLNIEEYKDVRGSTRFCVCMVLVRVRVARGSGTTVVLCARNPRSTSVTVTC